MKRIYEGNHYQAVHQIHLRYGPVVRIAPNELSFVEAQAWKDIYGHRVGIPEYPKDASQVVTNSPKHPHIIAAPRELHARLRKLISHGFSDKALREQEPILVHYTMKMIEGLKAHTHDPVDIVKWYNVSVLYPIGSTRC